MYRVLYVDDEPALLDITKRFLEKTGLFSVDCVLSGSEALGRIAAGHYDAVVADYQMPGMNGITLLKKVRETDTSLPFILFTGKGREEIVIEAINSGVDFYVQKGGGAEAQYADLSNKIKIAVERQNAVNVLRDSEQRLSDIINFLPDSTFVINRSGQVIAWNRAIEEMTGIAAGEMLGKGEYEYAIPFYGIRRKILVDLIFEPDEIIAKDYAHIVHEKDMLIADTVLSRPKGRTVTLMGKAGPLYNRQGEIVGAIESIRDISELKNAEKEIRAANEQISAAEEELRGQYEELAVSERRIRESESRLKYMLGFYEMARQPEKELLDYAVEGAGSITGSPLGYLAFLNDEESELTMYAWSQTSMRECSMREKPIIYPVEKTGLWGEAVRQRRPVITNDYQSPNLLKKGYPEGHPHIIRHMNVPVMDRDRIVIVAGVANKPSDYEETDVRELTILMQGLWQVLKRRRAEEELRAANEQISASDEELRGQYQELTTAQAELQKRQQQLEEITGTFPGVVYQFYARPDGTMGMYYVSDRSQEVLGISSNAAEFFGRFTGQVDPRDREAFLNSVNEAVRLQSPWNFEGRFVKPSGGNIWFYGISRPFVRGTEIVFSGVLLDITERRRDEEQSRESRERFRRIFEDSPLGIAIVSADFRFRMVNRQFCEMLMYSEAELLDKSFPEITHPDYIVPDIAEVRKIYSGEREMYRTEKRYVKKDGSFLWASLTASAVKDDAGKVLYTIALIEDITERKQAEGTIVRVNKKLNILNDLTRRDLTSQIFILKSYLELVIESAAGQDKILRHLQKIEQIIRSINDITEFTRDYQNMGESPPKWQNVKLALLFGISHVSLAGIRHSIETENLEVFADPLLEKAFQGIFENTIAHGGLVSTVQVRYRETPDGVAIIYEDDGAGIPQEMKERIFSRDGGIRASIRGLFFVREILDLTGITIRETGEPGKGARFEITVPKGMYRFTGTR
ncbi:MAG: PAS domain S-box protein [Methanoregula sp.]|jgi:PAS domain S-box-containing protein|uniref:PAS domain S-box protein n=1 Tax=Methanoregula sp. TaxID=2052170 RepID=UPI003D0FE4E0